MMNEVRPLMKAILKNGEVTQIGMGATWWERSITFMDRIREQAAKVVKNSWQRFLDHGRQHDGNDGPDITM